MKRFANSLSGRILVLTIVFVMLAEVMIFVPSVARFREDYLRERLERGQIASLTLLSGGEVDEMLEYEILKNAEVFTVMLDRDDVRTLALGKPMPSDITATYDMRAQTSWTLIKDAMLLLVRPKDTVIKVIGEPVKEAGMLIEVTLTTMPLRDAMVDYGLRVLALSALISVFTALLLFLSARALLVRPIRRVVASMQYYAKAPEETRRVIMPSASIAELREAETVLSSMQTDLTASLKQKDRLAQLGEAVSKISHDLRNILTTAQLFTDRIEASADPAVARTAPKLIGSIQRAVNLCETTLSFGKAEEAPPQLADFALAPLVQDVIESEAHFASTVDLSATVPAGLHLTADAEQVHRILSNLVRNAHQAILAHGSEEQLVRIDASEDEETCTIRVSDTGPGLPAKAREHLFKPFQGSARKGGSGLGLAIAAELVRGHGGKLMLEKSDETGTTFAACFPKPISD